MNDVTNNRNGRVARNRFARVRLTRSRGMYELELATSDDARSVHEFFTRSLYNDEPLVAANGPHVVPKWREGLSSAVLAEGRSVVARDAVTGDVVGCALIEEPPQTFPYIYTHDSSDVKKMFEYIEKASSVLEEAPGAVEIRFLAVDKSWRGRGIARAIIEASMNLCRQEGFVWSKIYCTSHYSNLLMEKMKWKKLYTFSYKEYASLFDSSIKIPPEPHTHCTVYICDLTKCLI